MNTQSVPSRQESGTLRETLARNGLKTKQGIKEKSSLFGVLYNFLLYAAIPVAFEMSYVKIFQNSMNAYAINDVMAIGRLIIYFTIQWVLGILVRKGYIKTSLKRVTLVIMILLQVKEAFFEEVLLDMMISMILESGIAVLFFMKFAHLVVLLQIMSMCLIIFELSIELKSYQLFDAFKKFFEKVNNTINYYMHQMMGCMQLHIWYRHDYCYRYSTIC